MVSMPDFPVCSQQQNRYSRKITDTPTSPAKSSKQQQLNPTAARQSSYLIIYRCIIYYSFIISFIIQSFIRHSSIRLVAPMEIIYSSVRYQAYSKIPTD